MATTNSFPPSQHESSKAFPTKSLSQRGSMDGSNKDALLTLLACSSKPPKQGGRLPESLKQIFLESNQGKQVDEPPADHSAFKTFVAPSMMNEPMEFFSPGKLAMRTGTSQMSLHDILTAATEISIEEEGPSTEAEEEAQGLAIIQQLQQKRAKAAGLPRPLSPKPVTVASAPRSYPSARSPQVFLDVMLRTLGYPTKIYKTLETAYYNEPTPLQTSSYHARLQEMIRSQDDSKLREMLTCGISTNPCNRFGESLLHSACRNGNTASVKVMLECGASVQVSDSAGRTILHSALFASTPCFEMVDLILQTDRHLLQLSDRLGTPLSYIPRYQWGMWIDFIYAKRHVYFPNRRQSRRLRHTTTHEKKDQQEDQVVTKLNQPPNSCPLDDPPNALTPEVAAMVVSGKLSPKEAKCLMEDDTTGAGSDESLETDTYGTDSVGDSLEDDDDDDDDDDDSWYSEDEEDEDEEEDDCIMPEALKDETHPEDFETSHSSDATIPM